MLSGGCDIWTPVFGKVGRFSALGWRAKGVDLGEYEGDATFWILIMY